METRWFVIASNTGAKIFAVNPNAAHRHLNLITNLDHPEGSALNRDFSTDRPGHFNTGHAARGSFEEPDHKEIENDHFSKKIAAFLDAARNKHEFHTITLVALPHFHGLLEKHLNSHVKDLIDNVIHKNLADKSTHELEDILLKGIL